MHFVCIGIAAFKTPLQKVTETKAFCMYWNDSVWNCVTYPFIDHRTTALHLKETSSLSNYKPHGSTYTF